MLVLVHGRDISWKLEEGYEARDVSAMQTVGQYASLKWKIVFYIRVSCCNLLFSIRFKSGFNGIGAKNTIRRRKEWVIIVLYRGVVSALGF